MNTEEFQEYVVGKFKEWDKFINGNGTPGVKVRLDRVEQCHKTIAKIGMVVMVPFMTAVYFLIRHIVK